MTDESWMTSVKILLNAFKFHFLYVVLLSTQRNLNLYQIYIKYMSRIFAICLMRKTFYVIGMRTFIMQTRKNVIWQFLLHVLACDQFVVLNGYNEYTLQDKQTFHFSSEILKMLYLWHSWSSAQNMAPKRDLVGIKRITWIVFSRHKRTLCITNDYPYRLLCILPSFTPIELNLYSALNRNILG